jgi:curved DNA-binding protein
VSLADAYRGTTMQLEMRGPDDTTRRLEVKIPAGVRTGSRVRVRGQGSPGQGGAPAGDIYLVVSVTPDPRFERRGDDLHTQVGAPLESMLLGGEARVPTPDGRTLALSIPPATQDGRVFRLRGQGMPRLGAPNIRGDLHAEIHARLPEGLTNHQRELIEEFARSGAGSTDGAVRR